MRERIRGARVAADTLDALVLAEAYLQAYRIEKASAGALDFADLIEKTKALLASRPAAAWVLFALVFILSLLNFRFGNRSAND